MARKSKAVKDELLKKRKQLEEVERLYQEAEAEDANRLDKLKDGIDKMVEAEGLFCGVILTHDDLVNVISVALKTGESVKIPYRLYYNE
jgi:uncharacterized Fe-S cluster-containing protein